MWFRVHHWFSKYHSLKAKRHYQGKRFALCLHHLERLSIWDKPMYQSPIFSGYLAMCHYQLKDWSHLAEEVERALFLLRRHIQDNTEALVLWEELKSHLADLRFLDQNQTQVKREATDNRR